MYLKPPYFIESFNQLLTGFLLYNLEFARSLKQGQGPQNYRYGKHRQRHGYRRPK